jgi:probable F420-dependent oxidoreductase
MTPHKFRFGVQSFSAPSAKEWRERALRAEALGYDVLHLADHLIGPGPALEATNHPLQELAAVPAIAMAAEATSTLRVGCRVFCIDYRHPVVLAKEAATLDLLSEGRLELGLGAGWLKGEYEAVGIEFDRAGVRIERLAETVAFLKAYFTGEPLSIDGPNVHARGFAGVPLPVQRPHPPIMIGGGGPKVLALAAREADIVSFNFNNRAGVIGADGVLSATEELTREKVELVRREAGNRADSLELEVGAYFTFVTDAGEQTAAGMGAAFGLSAEEMTRHPHALIGGVDSICEELERRRETLGFSFITVPDTALEAFAPVVARLG